MRAKEHQPFQSFSAIGEAVNAATVYKRKNRSFYADFKLAVATYSDDADFFPIRVFGEHVETAEAITKGTWLFISGHIKLLPLQQSSGETTIRSRGKIIADYLYLL